MELVLTEVSLALLLCVVVTITLTCVNLFGAKDNNSNGDDKDDKVNKMFLCYFYL